MKKHFAQKLQLRRMTITTLTAKNIRGGGLGADSQSCAADCAVDTYNVNSCIDICMASMQAGVDGVCNASNPCDSISIAGPITMAGTICLKCFRD
jgi:hypothetical protein